MPYLICLNQTPEERIYQLKFGSNTIGRSSYNSITIVDQSLSRSHAAIIIADEFATIKDLNSRNHTFVNEVKIDRSELKDGDAIRCGNVKFKFLETISDEDLAPTNEVLFAASDTEEVEISVSSTIVKQISSEQTSFAMENLLEIDPVGISVLKFRQQDAHQRTVDKLKVLLEVSKQLFFPEQPEQLLEKILDLLFEIMNIERAAILTVNEATGKIECKAVKLLPGIAAINHFYSKKIAHFVFAHGKAILTTDARIDPRLAQSHSIVAQAIHASMAVPLKPREEIIGVLYVDNLSQSHVYTEEDLEFLAALGNQAAIAIDNAQLYKQMQAEALMRNKLERFFPQSIGKKLREEGNLDIVETEVTAMFADISNFTKISSTLEPRQIIAMLNDYFEVMVERIIFPHEGTLEKYIGDALLAIWGAPYQQANDAWQAVRTAIEMQYAVQSLNRKWMQQGKQPIQIHIGINTGKVAAGNIGSQTLIQYATIGDTTNVTSRICHFARAAEIAVSQSTFNKLKTFKLPFEKMPLVKIKGKEQPLQLYRLLWQQVQTRSQWISF
ncbi:GAF domain-containing protein [Pleurocapsales cyanobacterium LEGE 06147]|nr:GAF domain-containing protein [Pleurocapsales cyanobacterium LEGE 06147]